MSKVVCRVGKIKSFSKIGKAGKHNYRLDSEALRNHINQEMTKFNEVLFGSNDLIADCKARINQADKCANGKLRSNAVLAVEMILSASPAFFNDPENPDNLDNWKKANIDWLKKEYGPNFVNAVLHRDESTEHIHAFIIPIDADNKLNCRCILGGRDTLKNLQTNSYEAVKHLGLKRGTPKIITGAVHKQPSVWHGEQQEIAKDEKSITKAIDKVPVVKSNILGYVKAEEAHEHYTTKTKEEVKKATPKKIISLTNDNKELKAQELLHRKDKKKAKAEKELAEKIAEEEKSKAKNSEQILVETTAIYTENLKVAEANAYKTAMEFLNRPENKNRLQLAEKLPSRKKIELFDFLQNEMKKEFSLKNVDKVNVEKQVNKLREKILSPNNKNNGLSL